MLRQNLSYKQESLSLTTTMILPKLLKSNSLLVLLIKMKVLEEEVLIGKMVARSLTNRSQTPNFSIWVNLKTFLQNLIMKNWILQKAKINHHLLTKV